MICERCGTRRAEIHIVRVQGGTLATLHLCPHCAGEPEKTPRSARGISLPPFGTPLGTGGQEGDQANPEEDPRCLVCGWSWEDVERQDRLGCEHCGEVFGERLRGSFAQEDVPPVSPDVFRERRYTYLRELLQNALAREAYEEAAGIRDQMRALEAPADPSVNSLTPSGQWVGPESCEERRDV